MQRRIVAIRECDRAEMKFEIRGINFARGLNTVTIIRDLGPIGGKLINYDDTRKYSRISWNLPSIWVQVILHPLHRFDLNLKYLLFSDWFSIGCHGRFFIIIDHQYETHYSISRVIGSILHKFYGTNILAPRKLWIMDAWTQSGVNSIRLHKIMLR